MPADQGSDGLHAPFPVIVGIDDLSLGKHQPGAPALPVFGLTLPVPEGCRPRAITVVPGATTLLPLEHPVAHAEEPLPLSAPAATRSRRTPRDHALYGRAFPYPDYRTGEQQRPRCDRRHGADLLTLALHPVQTVPRENLLRANGTLTVTVEWEPLPDDLRTSGWRPRRKLSRDAARAAEAASPLHRAARRPHTTGDVKELDGTPGALALDRTGELDGTSDVLTIGGAVLIRKNRDKPA